MKQCKRCGMRDFEPQDVTYFMDSDDDGWQVQRIMHTVIDSDHWPACDGNRCIEMLCPMEIEELCGPIIELGHGGNLFRRQVVAY